MTTAIRPKTEPQTLRLRDIIRTIPRDCFQPNMWRAVGTVIFSVAMAVLGYVTLIFNPSPWLLPFEWIFTGTALTGWFVIGHDCGHRSFARKLWVNNLVGTVMFLPLIFPFHGWRLGHDRHHRYTNHIEFDNAWRPFSQVEFTEASGLIRSAYKLTRTGLWWMASTLHWARTHFINPELLEPRGKRDRRQFYQSAIIVVVFGATALPALTYFTGWWGLVKFWLMPWLVFHFWLSTFTIVHHTHPDISFKTAAEWNAAEAQLSGTVHCDYPAWVEWLCHDINVHIPHHVSTGIPSYHLRAADRALQDKFGDRMVRTKFDWTLMSQVLGLCHLWGDRKPYQTFREYEAARQM
ncbi:MAG: fatty acid desaturase [Cyanobacteria bacterium P01_F01_bin.33]